MRRAAPLAAALAFCLAFVAAAPLFAQPPAAPEFASGWIDKKAVESRRFMVAAANPLATDAAIAVQLVLGLVEPQSSGLGGGAFLLYHDARSRRLLAYDARETAPAAATRDRARRGRLSDFAAAARARRRGNALVAAARPRLLRGTRWDCAPGRIPPA